MRTHMTSDHAAATRHAAALALVLVGAWLVLSAVLPNGTQADPPPAQAKSQIYRARPVSVVRRT